MKTKDENAVLYSKIREKGRLSIGRLSNAELLVAIKLSDKGLIKFDRTRRGNPSRFLVTKENA